jgi:hypothetical protein
MIIRERESVCVCIKITYPYFICGVRLKIVNIIKLCQNILKKFKNYIESNYLNKYKIIKKNYLKEPK